MSERFTPNIEFDKSPENQLEKDGSKAELDQKVEATVEKPKTQEEIKDLAKSVQEKAESGEKTLRALDDSQNTTVNPSYIGKSLRDNSLKQVLTRTRKRLPFDQKVLSKIVHGPIIDTVSEVSGKTVARPSGLAMGGAFSLVTSLFVLWASYFFGYEYNFLVGIMAFVGGFFVSLIIELFLKVLFRRKTTL